MTQHSFDLAIQHHQAGRLLEAERLYREIIQQTPNHAGALHYLSVIAYQMGRPQIALELNSMALGINPAWPEALSDRGDFLRATGQLDEAIAACRRAIALRPNLPEAHSNLGNALTDKGLPDEAIAAYRTAIALRPTSPESHNNLGNALKQKGRLGEAVAAFRKAIAQRPSYPQAHYNLGVVLSEQGQLDEAVAAYRQAISLQPNYPEAYCNLGVALSDQGQSDEEIKAYRQAIALKPAYFEARSNLGAALNERGQTDEAILACRAAIAIKPDDGISHCNLGNALREKGCLDEAIAACRRAITLKPDSAESYRNLGASLYDKGSFEEAIAACRQAVVIKPEYAEAHHNLAMLLLLRGDFARGWSEHEWRTRVKRSPSARWSSVQPQWDGRELPHGSILLHAEQGLGDAIQFVRYLPLVAKRVGKVIVACDKRLYRLLRSLPVDAHWVASGEPLPPFDVQCPLLSLPFAFGTTAETIPNNVPYLHADVQEVERWRERLKSPHRSLKIGLAWAGSSTHKNDGNRSTPLSNLAPFLSIPGVAFHSLQTGPAAEQARRLPAGVTLLDWSQDLHDLADTAALIANLDLVISVDTAVVHLAGALGKPVWTMLPFVPDWRWQLDRDDTPWYPTMRLFRQKSLGGWSTVIREVVHAVAELSLRGNKTDMGFRGGTPP